MATTPSAFHIYGTDKANAAGYYPQGVSRLDATGVDLNSTGDVISFTGLPAKFVVNQIVFSTFSATPGALLTATLRTAASGAGTSIVGSIAALNAIITSTAQALLANPVSATLGASPFVTSSALYLNVSAANGSALTANVTVLITSLV